MRIFWNTQKNNRSDQTVGQKSIEKGSDHCKLIKTVWEDLGSKCRTMEADFDNFGCLK